MRIAEGHTPITTAVPATVVTERTSSADEPRAETPAGAPSLEVRVLELVREDPFFSISEIKRIINSESTFDKKVGWWKIRSVLRKNDLGSRKKRFRYARTR
jgi:hypothetical protein